MWGMPIMVSKVLTLLVALCICSSKHGLGEVTTMSLSREENLELELELEGLNKPPVKTIQYEEGDIIDCIDINKQPALDHPLLKHHKVQMRPRWFPVGMTKTSSKAGNPSEIRFKREACPFGTVPIHRTQKDDLVRAKSISKGVTTDIGHMNLGLPGKHVAYVKAKEFPGNAYHGAVARVSVHNVSVEQDQFSSASIWFRNGPDDQINLIIVGWMVSPAINGDNVTRLFIYWTGDGYKTGCYNMLCKGFVQVDRELTPKYPLTQASIYGGDQFAIKILVYQDQHSGNWWLVISHLNVVVGYWPKEIFSHLGEGAKHVAWGGAATPGKNGISPPMGSGRKPDGDYRHAAFFINVQYLDKDNATHVPSRKATEEYVDGSGCYALKINEDRRLEFLGYSFTYGGPGGSCGD